MVVGCWVRESEEECAFGSVLSLPPVPVLEHCVGWVSLLSVPECGTRDHRGSWGWDCSSQGCDTSDSCNPHLVMLH